MKIKPDIFIKFAEIKISIIACVILLLDADFLKIYDYIVLVFIAIFLIVLVIFVLILLGLFKKKIDENQVETQQQQQEKKHRDKNILLTLTGASLFLAYGIYVIFRACSDKYVAAIIAGAVMLTNGVVFLLNLLVIYKNLVFFL